MRVLVTGASGFLGGYVVSALRRAGLPVRALHRGARGGARPVSWDANVEVVKADLRESDLLRACAGCDAVVHLGLSVDGDPGSVLATAVRGTERLVAAMAAAHVRRMVLASSVSVYDWTAVRGDLTESSPLERHPESRDAYTKGKLEQERIAHERCPPAGISLSVLRLPFVWGPGRSYPPTLGRRIGPVHVLVEPSGPLPLVHAENAADAFAAVLAAGQRGEGTFNLVDHPDLTAREYLEDHLARSAGRGLVVPVSYSRSLAWVTAIHRATPAALRGRLPSFVGPARFAARYGRRRIDGARLRLAIGWHPPLTYAECQERTLAG